MRNGYSNVTRFSWSVYIQKKLIMNAFITSQFGCSPFLWMCHNRSINTIHERAPQLVYMDSNLSSENLLKMSSSVSIHNRNLQQLTVEIYKAPNNLSSSLMSESVRVKETKYKIQS